MSKNIDKPNKSSRAEIDVFVRKIALTPNVKPRGKPGRLVFAMDATASREPTWDHACHIQGQMFEQTSALGGLEIQLCYYRGYLEFRSSPWLTGSEALLNRMTRVRCLGGRTQIGTVLEHVIKENKQHKVNALVFVGDCVEEDIERLCHFAGKLGIYRVPVFLFHEGEDHVAGRTFKQIAHLSGGAYCRFDASSATQLRDLLSAVAVYAAGGRLALAEFSKRKGGALQQLTHQIYKD